MQVATTNPTQPTLELPTNTAPETRTFSFAPAHPASSSHSGLDLMACAECKQRFTAVSADRMPTGLSCGHVLCVECAAAVTIVSSPACTVCKVGIDADSAPLLAFAALCDAENSLLACAEFCDAESRRSGGCDVPDMFPPLREEDSEQDAQLRAKAEQYRAAAAAASAACNVLQDRRTALQHSADEAVEKVVAAAAQLKAQVDEVCAARVKNIRQCCEDGLKQLEAEHDELPVRASQLGAAVAMCARAVGSKTDRAKLVLDYSLRSFDVLACKPVCVSQPTVSVLHGVHAPQHGYVQGIFAYQRVIPASHMHRGLAISPDDSHFAVHKSWDHGISVYAVADGARVCTFGGQGAEPGNFDCPEKLVYHPDSGNLLVADRHNKRVQEVTPTGEAVRLIGAGVIDDDICGIACNRSMVAVGKAEYGKKNGVMLFDYGSGALVNSFGDCGDGVGQLKYCRGMRFTADGRHIVVANDNELSQFTVEGVFVKEVGRGALKLAADVEIAPNGDWIACDSDGTGIVVFSGGDGDKVRRWGGCGDSDGKFFVPIALAQSASVELWVLDNQSTRVQVFV